MTRAYRIGNCRRKSLDWMETLGKEACNVFNDAEQTSVRLACSRCPREAKICSEQRVHRMRANCPSKLLLKFPRRLKISIPPTFVSAEDFLKFQLVVGMYEQNSFHFSLWCWFTHAAILLMRPCFSTTVILTIFFTWAKSRFHEDFCESLPHIKGSFNNNKKNSSTNTFSINTLFTFILGWVEAGMHVLDFLHVLFTVCYCNHMRQWRLVLGSLFLFFAPNSVNGWKGKNCVLFSKTVGNISAESKKQSLTISKSENLFICFFLCQNPCNFKRCLC